jgi:F-type H+-transporting ATPase subunit delta
MASRASARRYARALFDVLGKSGDPDAALRELQAVAGVLAAYPDLRKALTSPGVPLGAKVGIMRELMRLQPVSKVINRLLLLIVEHDDVNELDEIVSAFEQRVLDFHQVVRAEVTSAEPLESGHVLGLENAFAAVTGKRVILSVRVDPAILGGLVTQIGSRVYDGSVVRQLERVRERLRAQSALY